MGTLIPFCFWEPVSFTTESQQKQYKEQKQQEMGELTFVFLGKNRIR